MDYSIQKCIHGAALGLLADPINEAYHENDRKAKDELRALSDHHFNNRRKHYTMGSEGLCKGKDVKLHDLAMLAHEFAGNHYDRMRSQLPDDFHNDRDFYDKLHNLISSRADKKTKDCGIDPLSK